MELKLIINKDTNQFVFALADKDFVDFLFDIPSIPVGSFLSLFQTTDVHAPVVTEGSLYNLCDTIKNFDDSYIRCSRSYYDYNPNLYKPCPSNTPKENLLKPMTSIDLRCSGYYDNVKATMFIVMDDLSVVPFSKTSQNTSLKNQGYSASDLGNGKLDEIKVIVGKLAVMRLLKESLMTKNVLSTVFLGDKYDGGSNSNDSGDQDDYVVLDQGCGMPPSDCSPSRSIVKDITRANTSKNY